jgi:hypothetical protein
MDDLISKDQRFGYSALVHAFEKGGHDPNDFINEEFFDNDEPDYGALSDNQIIIEAAGLRASIELINQQLEDDATGRVKRGEEWRRRALKARSHLRRQMDIFSLEYGRRRKAEKLQVVRENGRTNRDAQRLAVAEKFARLAASERRQKTQSDLFVKAAWQLLGPELVQSLWGYAKRLFPDDAAWNANSPVDSVMSADEMLQIVQQEVARLEREADEGDAT